MVHTSASARDRFAGLTTLLLICLLCAAGPAVAEEPPAAPTAPTAQAAPTTTPESAATSVSQLGADPTVAVARHRHCVKSQLRMKPRYSGGRVVSTWLFINGRSVAKRRSAGSLRVSATRMLRGSNRYELISRFADGRTASTVGTLRRCKGR